MRLMNSSETHFALGRTEPKLVVKMGIVGHNGREPIKAGDMAARATWALARHAQEAADGLAIWPSSPATGTEPSA